MKSSFARIAFFILMAAISFPTITQAQNISDLSMDWVKFESGQGPITGGFAFTARYSSEDLFLEVSAQSQAAWITVGRYFRNGGFSLDLGGSLGHQQDALWVGPYVDASFYPIDKVGLGILYWPGFFEEEPTPWKIENDGSENPESVFMGNFGGVYADIGPITLSYYILDFMDDPVNHLPGGNVKFLMRGGMEAFFGATRNQNNETWMWVIGGKWTR